MKTLQIYKRVVTERTGFRKYPFKQVTQYTIVFDGKQFSNHNENIYNIRLRVPFYETFKTRSRAKAIEFRNALGRTQAELWLKDQLQSII